MSFSRDFAWFDRHHALQHLPVQPTGTDPLACSAQRYFVEAPIGRVFDAYVATSPAVAWPAERITFRCAFLEGSTQRIVPADPWPGLSVGMRLYADLSVVRFRQLLSIMVGVQVTRVEPRSEIRYDYLVGAVTSGWNAMRFTPTARGRTRVDHVSFYRGTAPIHRALMPLLQPTLHVGFVDAMHARMKGQIERGATP